MNIKINLCDDCDYNIAECISGKIVFGDGVGDDNIIECETYDNIKIIKELIGRALAKKSVTEFEKEVMSMYKVIKKRSIYSRNR